MIIYIVSDNMSKENITIDNYDNPEQVFINLIKQYKNRLERISSDLTLIKDPAVYGYAHTLFLNLQREYFYLLSKDLELAKLFEDDTNIPQENLDDIDIPADMSYEVADNIANNLLNDIFKTK